MAQASDLEPLRSGAGALPSSADPDSPSTPRRSRVRELLRSLDRRLSSRGRHHRHAAEGAAASPRGGGGGEPGSEDSDELGDGAPPEWALLLVGCLLGLATGICVAAFNRGVSERSAWGKLREKKNVNYLRLGKVWYSCEIYIFKVIAWDGIYEQGISTGQFRLQ